MAYSITDACTGCGACRRICPVQAIQGEKKGRHTIDPGICIECGACGRVCAFSAVQKPDGSQTEHLKPALWPHPEWKARACLACNVCVEACPVGIIHTRLRNGKVGLARYPFLALEKNCLGCGLCADACPIEVISMRTPRIPEGQMR